MLARNLSSDHVGSLAVMGITRLLITVLMKGRSAHETPGDLIRLALGVAGCLWMVIQLFMLPEDEEGYRIWLYLGPVVVPLALAVAIAIW